MTTIDKIETGTRFRVVLPGGMPTMTAYVKLADGAPYGYNAAIARDWKIRVKIGAEELCVPVTEATGK